MLNYNALQAELTLDYNERTSLSSTRIFFSTLASILAALIPLEIVKQFADVRQGYIAMGLAFGLLFALPFIATVLTARERESFQKPPAKFNWREAFIEPFRMRTFVYALLMYLFAFVAIDAVSSIVIYYVKYFLNRGSEANYVSGAMLVFQVLSLPFYETLSKRTSKRAGFVVVALIWAGSMLLSFVIVPDIPDVDEFETGQRREGIYSSLVTLFRKFSSALAIFAVSNAIGWAGYVPPVEQVVNGASRLIDQPQSANFLLVLRLIFAFLPIVLLAGSVFFALRYPLSPGAHARLNRILACRRNAEPEPPELQVEAEELKVLLI
jgi:oligogalacturonide transporter